MDLPLKNYLLIHEHCSPGKVYCNLESSKLYMRRQEERKGRKNNFLSFCLPSVCTFGFTFLTICVISVTILLHFFLAPLSPPFSFSPNRVNSPSVAEATSPPKSAVHIHPIAPFISQNSPGIVSISVKKNITTGKTR